ncbi:MAG: hypothetical protein RL553_1360 [Planctomycetota bacterium]|jgi:3-oxoacyl-[acyl-carrier-protein] synthase-3
MKYSRVYLDAIGYELPPVVVSTEELETRLLPVYEALKFNAGQLLAWTGIQERRWWEPGFSVAEGATLAARKALDRSNVTAQDLEVVIYSAVCREQFEPATACSVAAKLGVGSNALVYDISNACLGVLNGILDIANRIELGQIRAGVVVSCETSREINDTMIAELLKRKNIETFKDSLATLTGGSGAVAVVVTDGSFSSEKRRKLIAASAQSAAEHHSLCRWGLTNEPIPDFIPDGASPKQIIQGVIHAARHFMTTDSVAVLKYGVDLGMRTWKNFVGKIGWTPDAIDKVICHQVGAPHRDSVLKALGISLHKDYSTFPFLGNIGTVSLPLTAAIAEERKFLLPGDRVGLLGIGSGLNCLMLGVEW